MKEADGIAEVQHEQHHETVGLRCRVGREAAVFPTWWGSGLLAVATGVVASHVMVPLKAFSWRSKALLSTGAAIVVAGMIAGFGPVRRPFELFRANLSGQWLAQNDLRGANLSLANLSRTDLIRAYLIRADLSDANLLEAKLIRAELSFAKLSGANLSLAKLSRASLSPADLNGA
jgi:hypothetical protein